MELTKKELYEIEGGASWGIIAGVAAAVIYVIGCFSGYTNPSRCSN